MRRVVVLALCLLGASCKEEQPVLAPTPVVTASPLIPPLPPNDDANVPAPIVEAQAIFVEGVVAYESGRFADAAEAFMRVASTMARDRGKEHWQAFAVNRLFAYRNALIAHLQAGTHAEARAALERASEADPLCREGLAELIAMVPADDRPQPTPAREAPPRP